MPLFLNVMNFETAIGSERDTPPTFAEHLTVSRYMNRIARIEWSHRCLRSRERKAAQFGGDRPARRQRQDALAPLR
jgi:hypothetical protein